MVLQRDHQAFHRPQRPKRNDEDQRQPQHRMDPIGRVVQDLGNQRGSDHDEAGEKHDEDGRPVARIGEVVVETANVAARPQGQEPLKQLALTATRAGARQSRAHRSRKRLDYLLSHDHDVVFRWSPHKRGPTLCPRIRSFRVRKKCAEIASGATRRLALGPTHRCRRTGTARPRRRSASTRRRIRNPDAGSA